MASGFEVKADVRERTGKGAARALRRDGMIPAVIYGNNEPPLAIAVPGKEVTLALYGGGFLTNVWTIDVGGRKVEALARDYQREPVKDALVHVDFLRVTPRSRVTVDVPVHFTGEDEAPGLRGGGVLNVIAHTVAVEAAATRIPDSISVSVAGLEMGATITSADVTLPANVSFVSEETFPIATIAAPVVEAEAEETETAVAAPDSEAVGGEGESSAEG